jgi:hypothetical protein
MQKSDATNRYNGLIQMCEGKCGLGAGGIINNANLYSDFIGWLNQWNKTFASIAIMSWDGADFDDIGYTTQPHGYFSAATTRDYNFDESYRMLKLKLVNVSYDGKTFVPAKPFDAQDRRGLALNDPNIDQRFSTSYPKYDLRANGFDLYPAFTSDQIATVNSLLPNGSGGNKAIYVEWFRAPRDFDNTSDTDSYEPCLDLQFHHAVAVGASWEYCKLYKPETAAEFQGDLYGARTARGQLIRQGVIQDIQDWYNSKSPSNVRLKMHRRVKI